VIINCKLLVLRNAIIILSIRTLKSSFNVVQQPKQKVRVHGSCALTEVKSGIYSLPVIASVTRKTTANPTPTKQKYDGRRIGGEWRGGRSVLGWWCTSRDNKLNDRNRMAMRDEHDVMQRL